MAHKCLVCKCISKLLIPMTNAPPLFHYIHVTQSYPAGSRRTKKQNIRQRPFPEIVTSIYMHHIPATVTAGAHADVAIAVYLQKVRFE